MKNAPRAFALPRPSLRPNSIRRLIALSGVPLLLWFTALLAATTPAASTPPGLAVECNPAEQERAAVATLNQIRRDPAAAGQWLGLDLGSIPSRPPLSANAILARVARERAEDMVARRYYGHVDPEGVGPNQKVAQAGYPLPSYYLGNPSNNFIESISAGRQTGQAAIAALIVDRGVSPPGHRIHLLGLNDTYNKHTEIGIGFACSARSQYKYYMVVLTAYPDGRPAIPIARPPQPDVQPNHQPTTPGPTMPNVEQPRPTRDMPREILNAHNQWRKHVGVAPLQWSADLAIHAQEWAHRLLATGKFEHRESGGYGENIFMTQGRQWTAAEVVNRWASEAKNYNHATNQCQGVCGHYTQIVWRDTTQMGCGIARSSRREIWVCNYNPPGNFVGERPF